MDWKSGEDVSFSPLGGGSRKFPKTSINGTFFGGPEVVLSDRFPPAEKA